MSQYGNDMYSRHLSHFVMVIPRNRISAEDCYADGNRITVLSCPVAVIWYPLTERSRAFTLRADRRVRLMVEVKDALDSPSADDDRTPAARGSFRRQRRRL